MTNHRQKAFWERGFFRERMKLSEWKFWLGLIFLIVMLSGGLHSIYMGTYGEHVSPGILSLIFIYFTVRYLKERRKLRDENKDQDK